MKNESLYQWLTHPLNKWMLLLLFIFHFSLFTSYGQHSRFDSIQHIAEVTVVSHYNHKEVTGQGPSEKYPRLSSKTSGEAEFCLTHLKQRGTDSSNHYSDDTYRYHFPILLHYLVIHSSVRLTTPSGSQ